ncbi:MAG: HNH endonuclease [Gammaproteobacteria bacterium]|nr:HNH endonuclease [Gammaproteobacteria bacterium]
MTTLILRTNVGGQPLRWISWQDAVLLYVKGQVIWTVGDEPMRFHGGINRCTGLRSYMDVHPVIAAGGQVFTDYQDLAMPLTNHELFSRDQHTCLYCLARLPDGQLTRDHVIPISRGGADSWSNVVTACRGCNQQKANRTPQGAGMRLHAVPYTPSYAEWLILRNRRILADQMVFLKGHCPRDSRFRD